MSSKKDKGKIKESKDRNAKNAAGAEEKMTKLMKAYEALCHQYDMNAYVPLKNQMKQNKDESKLQLRFLFEGTDRNGTKYWEDEILPDIFSKEDQLRDSFIRQSSIRQSSIRQSMWKRDTKIKSQTTLVRILPLLQSLRDLRYVYIQELLVWGVMVEYEEICCLTYLLNKSIYQLMRLELIDCLIDEKAITKLVPSINSCSTLRELILDCNEFGDAGCHALCKELQYSSWLYQLSLNHCGITKNSGNILGETINSSTIRELFLEGNNLQNEGVITMVGSINTAISIDLLVMQDREMDRNKEVTIDFSEVENIKDLPLLRKKKKSKGTKIVMLPKGPGISKLNIANNNLGRFGVGGLFSSVFSMEALKNLIFMCKDLEEIDLFANDIGDVAARLILEGLTVRRFNKYPQIGIRMCHIINQDLYETISKMAPGSKRKKRRR